VKGCYLELGSIYIQHYHSAPTSNSQVHSLHGERTSAASIVDRFHSSEEEFYYYYSTLTRRHQQARGPAGRSTLGLASLIYHKYSWFMANNQQGISAVPVDMPYGLPTVLAGLRFLRFYDMALLKPGPCSNYRAPTSAACSHNINPLSGIEGGMMHAGSP
jgi:hypothetical protein